ncbi:MAG: RNA polymerase sigma factor [Verrucomicrobiota bacterium]
MNVGFMEAPESRSAERGDEKVKTFESDGTSFALLVEQHQAKLYNFIYRYTQNRQDAEDLTQDTFVKAFRNFHRYDSQYPFGAWLFTIGRRTVYNHYRGLKPTEELSFDVVESAATPDEEVEHEDRKHELWEVAKKLKKEYQEVLALKYIEDLSIEEISRVLGKSKTNVKIRLFRARNQLKKLHGI